MTGLRFKFGRRLRELRLQQNWSQEMLAEEIGTSVHFVSLIERGVNAPSFETIETIAAALKTEPKELFDFPATDAVPKKLRRKLWTK